MSEDEVRKIAKSEATSETGCGVYFLVTIITIVCWCIAREISEDRKRIEVLEKSQKELRQGQEVLPQTGSKKASG